MQYEAGGGAGCKSLFVGFLLPLRHVTSPTCATGRGCSCRTGFSGNSQEFPGTVRTISLFPSLDSPTTENAARQVLAAFQRTSNTEGVRPEASGGMAVSWFLLSLGGMEGCSRRKDRGDYEDKWIDAGLGREGLARSLGSLCCLSLFRDLRKKSCRPPDYFPLQIGTGRSFFLRTCSLHLIH